MAHKSIGPGTVLAGRFRLEDLLQESAGAKFWRATDQILARSVAVHVVAATDPRAPDLLEAARSSATVSDVHFLRVLDAAQEDGVAYVVNEWAPGTSLDLMVADEPLPARRAAWLVKEVAEAITTAHQYGVAHGRLIPENVMVTETGSVKLIGFVIDSVLNGAPESPLGTSKETGTSTRGHESDVRNLGSLLYAALLGRWPGTGGSTLPDAPREHGRPLRPRQVRAGVPRPLDAICERVLNSDAHQNAMPLETAQEICAALKDFVGDPNSVAQTGHEPTAVISRTALPPDHSRTALPPDHDMDQDATDQDATDLEVGGPPWSGAGATADRGSAVDPEATQAGAPLFFDDDSSIGWAAPGDPALGSSGRDGARRASPPPPMPREPESRPLFAPDPPAGQVARPGSQGADQSASRTGHGTGSLPAIWGPDADSPDSDESEQWKPEKAGKSWLRLVAILAACVLIGIVVIFAVNLNRGSGEPETPASKGPSSQTPGRGDSSGPVEISRVSDFDPEGDPAEENPELAPLAIDGDPSTAWQTVTYFNNPQLGLLKEGVGLVVDLNKAEEVSTVQLTLVGRPTTLQVLAADEDASLPTSTRGLQVVAEAADAGPKLNLLLDEPVTSRYLVIWLTSVPPAEGGYVGQIAEIAVRS